MKVFWFDTETSGTNPHKHGIMQLAYIIEIDGRVEDQSTLYANCNTKEVTERALEITSFSADQIAEWPSPKKMYAALIKTFDRFIDKFDKQDKFIAGGYNVQFDLDFLRQLWFESGDKYFGSYFAFGVLDPAALFRYMQWKSVLPHREEQPLIKLTLSDLAGYYGLQSAGAHDAAFDIGMTRELMLRMDRTLRPTIGEPE